MHPYAAYLQKLVKVDPLNDNIDMQTYREIASILSSMGLSAVLNHAIEDNLIRIPVALLHSRTALQLEDAADCCANDPQKPLGSALLRQNALQRHGWKVSCSFSLHSCHSFASHGVRLPV